MLDQLIPNLSTLIITVRRNVLSSVMTTLMIIAIIVAWSARGNIAVWLDRNPTAAEQSERIVRGAESTKKITRALRQDLVDINADRVLIRSFYDQTDTVTSAIIPYVTTSHIVTSPGVSLPDSRIISIPRSYLVDITDRMFANRNYPPVCVHIRTSEIKHEYYARALRDSGVVEQYTCPILDINGAPIGIIIAAFMTDTKARPSTESIFTTLTDTSDRVAGYIDEVTSPEREVWYRKLLSF